MCFSFFLFLFLSLSFFPSLPLVLLLDYHSFHSENGSLWFLLPEPPHADMEGFLRSSFLLRLVSFPLLPFRIIGRAGGGSGLTGVKLSDTLLALDFVLCVRVRVCTCLCVCMCLYIWTMSNVDYLFNIFTQAVCVMIVFTLCVADWHAHPDSLQSDWKHTSTT